MKKSELKTGMRVKWESGDMGIAMIGIDMKSDLIMQGTAYAQLLDYNNDLTSNCNNDDIIAIYNPPSFNYQFLDYKKHGELIWELEQEKIAIELDGVEYSESTLRSLIKKATK